MKTLILGATKGLGYSLVKSCLERGDTVYGAGRTTDSLENCEAVFIDLSDPESIESCLSIIEKNDFDNFFWVAGTLLKGDFAKQSSQDILKIIDVNFRNALMVTHAVWKRFEKTQTQKHFVVVSSSSGTVPRNDEAVYVATKHAQVGFARSLGLENQNPNLHVSLILPGGMKTRFWDNHLQNVSDGFLDPDKVADHILKKIEEPRETFLEITIPRGSL